MHFCLIVSKLTIDNFYDVSKKVVLVYANYFVTKSVLLFKSWRKQVRKSFAIQVLLFLSVYLNIFNSFYLYYCRRVLRQTTSSSSTYLLQYYWYSSCIYNNKVIDHFVVSVEKGKEKGCIVINQDLGFWGGFCFCFVLLWLSQDSSCAGSSSDPYVTTVGEIILYELNNLVFIIVHNHSVWVGLNWIHRWYFRQ